jgi:NTP pyrophosphatase (non-canonical NTP hydrolase)
MELSDYQVQSISTAIYPGKKTINGLAYATLGLVGEAGEVAEKVKKILRDKQGILDAETKQALQKELGDVLWYLAAIATELDLSLDDVALMNQQKLQSRKLRNALSGNGDNR